MARKWIPMINPWDNPDEGPPIDEIVEVDCCGRQIFIRFLPERGKYQRFITKADARAGKGTSGDFAADKVHLPERWRLVQIPRNRDMLEEHKDARRAKKALDMSVDMTYADAHRWFREQFGREMRDDEGVTVTRGPKGEWQYTITADGAASVMPMKRK